MNIKEYIKMLIFGIIPLVICAVGAVFLIEIIAGTSPLLYYGLIIIFIVIFCYFYIKYLFWIDDKIFEDGTKK